MANKETGELTNATALQGNEIFHVVQSGNSRQSSLAAVNTFTNRAHYQIPQINGLYVPSDTLGFSTGTNTVPPQGTIGFYPFNNRCSVDGISVEVTTLAATSAIRAGLYTASATTGMPDQLIEEGTIILGSSTGIKTSTFTAPRVLTGPVWIAVTAFAGETTSRFRTGTNLNKNAIGFNSMNTVAPFTRLLMTYTYAALPENTSGIIGTVVGHASTFMVALRLG